MIGKGESDFGTFVLTGTYNAGNRVLEMARQVAVDARPPEVPFLFLVTFVIFFSPAPSCPLLQYIAEDDERCQMDIEQLKQHLIAAAAAAGTY